MKRTKQDKRWLKKTFKEAMDKELREHKSSFIVFSILRFLVLVILVRQLFMAHYEAAFFCVLTIVLLYVPSWVQVRLRIELPQHWKLPSYALSLPQKFWERSTPSMFGFPTGIPCSIL